MLKMYSAKSSSVFLIILFLYCLLIPGKWLFITTILGSLFIMYSVRRWIQTLWSWVPRRLCWVWRVQWNRFSTVPLPQNGRPISFHWVLQWKPEVRMLWEKSSPWTFTRSWWSVFTSIILYLPPFLISSFPRMLMFVSAAVIITCLVSMITILICCFCSKCPLYSACHSKYRNNDAIAFCKFTHLGSCM